MGRRNTRKYKKNRSHKKTKRMIGGEGENKDIVEQVQPLTDDSNTEIPIVTNDIPEVETPATETPNTEEITNEVIETPATDTSNSEETTIAENQLDTPVEKDELTEIIGRIKTLINTKPELEEYKSKLDNIDLNNIADKSKSIELFKSVEEKLQSLVGTTSTTTNETNKQKIPDGMVQILIPKENEHMVKECLIKKGCPVSEYNKDGELITTSA